MGQQCSCCGAADNRTEILEASEEQKALEQDPKQDVEGVYRLDMRKDGILGRSSIGNVVKTQHRNGKEIYVVKQMNKKCMEGNGWKEDVEALRTLEHPNICRVSDSWEDTMNVYLVMEFCQGGSLMSLAHNTEDLQVNEGVISVFVRQMIDALQHFHQHKLVHGDIRPEKWLFSEAGGSRRSRSLVDQNLKMINFGLSRKFGRRLKDDTSMLVPKSRDSERRGTSSGSRKLSTTWREERNLNCRAPEQLSSNPQLDEKSDVWALGVISYFLLSGQSPWAWAGYKEEIVKKAMYTFMPAELWRPISSEAKNFIALCLQQNASQRPSAEKCLQLPWMQLALQAMEKEPASPLSKTGIIADRVLATFRRLDHLNALEKACVITAAHRVPATGFEALNSTLVNMDQSGTGLLSSQQLFDALKEYGVPVHDLVNLGKIADSELQGNTIDYVEFLKAVDECQRNMQDSAIWAVFRAFDDRPMLKRDLSAMLKQGSAHEIVQEKFPEVSLEAVVEDLSRDGDTCISAEELKKLLRTYKPAGVGVASSSASDRSYRSPKSDRNSDRTSMTESIGQKSML